MSDKKKSFKELIDFPTDHLFKVVGESGEGFRDALRNLFDMSGKTVLSIDEKVSSKGSYTSYSVNVRIETLEELENYYTKISKLPNIKFYL